MLRYLVRRALFMVLVLFIVSLLTFFIFVKLPSGDPARRAAGKTSTPEQIENARQAFGLDRPLHVQYARFAKGLVPWPGLFLSEDVYYSYGNFVPVKEEIARRLPVTVTLAIGAVTIWLLLGIPLGRARRHQTPLGREPGARCCSHSSRCRCRCSGSVSSCSTCSGSSSDGPRRAAWTSARPCPPRCSPGAFILPWITVAMGYAAIYARMTRSNMIETMSEDYIRTARAKGLPERTVIARHGLRGALTPIVTMLGLDLGTMLGGLFITEALFGLPGDRCTRGRLDRSPGLPDGHGHHRARRDVHRGRRT